MALIFVASGGSNTAPYDTWAKAATSLATGLGAAAAGDSVIIQKDAVPSGDAELTVDTTYTVPASGVNIISATNDGGSAYTPSAMGNAYWIGNSTTNRSVTFAGNVTAFIYGLTIRTAGATNDSITLTSSSGARFDYENCYFWQGNTNAAAGIYMSVTRAYARATNCTFRFGATGQSIYFGALSDIIGGSVSSAGSAPTALFRPGGAGAAQVVKVVGLDASWVTNTLVADVGSANAPFDVHFDRCKFGTGVTVLAAQTSNHGSRVLVTDCSSGDLHGLFGYYDQFGYVSTDTGIYFSSAPDSVQDGATARKQSWKIVANSRATLATPFVSPPIPVYNTGTSSVTPYVEIARDGSTTAYKNDEVWLRVEAKTTSGETKATSSSDRVAVGGTGASQTTGAGTGSWTGLTGTAWSGKLDSGSALTPAEVGAISARVVVAAAITVYVDPQIRT